MAMCTLRYNIPSSERQQGLCYAPEQAPEGVEMTPESSDKHVYAS